MKLLIVEDNFLAAEGIKLMAKKLDYEVMGPIPDQAGALSFLKHQKPDVALLDFSLRDGNCLKIAEKLEEHDIPFVFITGYSEVPGLPEKYSEVAKLNKPFRQEDLQRILLILMEKA